MDSYVGNNFYTLFVYLLTCSLIVEMYEFIFCLLIKLLTEIEYTDVKQISTVTFCWTKTLLNCFFYNFYLLDIFVIYDLMIEAIIFFFYVKSIFLSGVPCFVSAQYFFPCIVPDVTFISNFVVRFRNDRPFIRLINSNRSIQSKITFFRNLLVLIIASRYEIAIRKRYGWV